MTNEDYEEHLTYLNMAREYIARGYPVPTTDIEKLALLLKQMKEREKNASNTTKIA